MLQWHCFCVRILCKSILQTYTLYRDDPTQNQPPVPPKDRKKTTHQTPTSRQKDLLPRTRWRLQELAQGAVFAPSGGSQQLLLTYGRWSRWQQQIFGEEWWTVHIRLENGKREMFTPRFRQTRISNEGCTMLAPLAPCQQWQPASPKSDNWIITKMENHHPVCSRAFPIIKPLGLFCWVFHGAIIK